MTDGIFAEYGVVVVAVTPNAIRRDPASVLRHVRRSYDAARRRPSRAPSAAHPRPGGQISGQ